VKLPSCCFSILIALTSAVAQTDNGRVVPRIATLEVEGDRPTVVHLGAGYTTSVRLPEEVSSVVVGNPATFKAEHSEMEPRLVFLKPITSQSAESNALITTRSGHEISLYLISAGDEVRDANVDFLIEYRHSASLVSGSPGMQTFLIAETESIQPAKIASTSVETKERDFVSTELEKQKALPSPRWQGKELLASVGDSRQYQSLTVLGFSVLNNSRQVIELLPPQIEFTATALHGKRNRSIKAEPVPVSDYRMTTRRLGPGQRADGVVLFERPPFKTSVEELQLEVATAAQVDRPTSVTIAFTSTSSGVSNESNTRENTN